MHISAMHYFLILLHWPVCLPSPAPPPLKLQLKLWRAQLLWSASKYVQDCVAGGGAAAAVASIQCLDILEVPELIQWLSHLITLHLPHARLFAACWGWRWEANGSHFLSSTDSFVFLPWALGPVPGRKLWSRFASGCDTDPMTIHKQCRVMIQVPAQVFYLGCIRGTGAWCSFRHWWLVLAMLSPNAFPLVHRLVSVGGLWVSDRWL
jgi:hypothetical protein